MNKVKRVLGVVLALLILISAVSIPQVQAEEEYEWVSKNYSCYNYYDGKWIISYKAKDSYNKDKRFAGTTQTNWRYDEKSKKNHKQDTYKSKYTFDANGNTKTITSYSGGKVTYKEVYVYNKKGQKTKLKEYNSNGKLTSTTIYKYDKKGNEVKCTIKFKDGSDDIVTTTKYTYSGSKIKKSVEKCSDGTSITTTYYNNGNTKKYTYKSNGYTFTNYYNSKEQNTKTVSSDATTKSTEKSTYKNGRLVKTVRNETDKASKKVTKVTYTYKHKTDANGNLTETICYQNKKPYYKDVYSDYIQVVKAEE